MAAFDRQAVGTRGGGFGLDAELARQREAKYDHGAEDEVKAWIETVTSEKIEGLFGDALRDGVLLCKLVNCISPGSVRRINQSRMPFKQMENVSNFLKVCRKLGVPEHSLFETVDLYEQKDLGLVVRCVFALGSAVQLTCPDFAGPHLGAKLHKENKRVFNEKQKQQARVNSSFSKMTMGSAHSMERSEVSSRGITFGAENSGKGDTTIVGKLAQGSHGIQERLPVDKSNSITFGAEKLGVGDTKILTKASTGSYGIMERGEISKANSVTFGAETAGTGNSAVMTKFGVGSSKIMERGVISKANDITFGAVSSQSDEPCIEKTGGNSPATVAAASDVISSDTADPNRSWFQAMTRVPDIIKERSSALDCFRRGCVAVYAHTYTLHMSYPRRLEAASVCHHKIKRS